MPPLSQYQTCDRCGAGWQIAWKCQIICPNCGARQDCSDLFVDDARVAERLRQPPAQASTRPQ